MHMGSGRRLDPDTLLIRGPRICNIFLTEDQSTIMKTACVRTNRKPIYMLAQLASLTVYI